MRAPACPAVQRRHPPAGRRLRPARLQPVGRARLHQRPQLHRPGRRSRCGRPTAARAPAGGGRRALHASTPSPSPTSSTSSSSATARRSSARSPRSSGSWKASGRTEGSRQRVLRGAGRACPACTCRRCTTSTTTAPRWSPSRPASADVPERVEKRTIADLGAWPYPKRQLVPLTEVVHDRLNVEIFRGCTRGCRFCQAGMITRPVRERPAEQVRRWCATACAAPATTRSASRRLSSADYSGIDDVVGDIINDPMCRAASGVSLPSLRVDAFTVGIATEIAEGAAHRPHLRARGRHVAHAPGHQQAHPRGGPLRRGRVGVLAGVAAGEALLPHRSAHRDRRGHARHRRAGPQLRRHRRAGTPTASR